MVWEAENIFYNRRNDFYRVYKGEELYWEKDLEGEREYLNFTSIEDGSFIGWVNHDTGELIDSEIYYSYNKDTWTLLDSNGITLNNGDVVYMKSTLKKNNGYLTSVTKYGTQHFTITGKVKGDGVCTSLVYGDAEVYTMVLYGSGNQFYDYENATFKNLFHSCTGLIVAPQIGFSRDSFLSNDCLAGMFYGCSNLISAPKLPYMKLRRACYGGIFYNCTSLVTAPNLPATNLGDYCYVNAFNGCTSLKEMPYLPAKLVRNYTYQGMFMNCTSLTSVIDLPATKLGSNAYYSMFANCYNITSVPSVLPANSFITEGYSLAPGVYKRMFMNCRSITTAPQLPAYTSGYPLAYGAYSEMFKGCTSLVTAPNLPAATVASGVYERMFEGCTSLVTTPSIGTHNPNSSSFERMFANCTSLTSADIKVSNSQDCCKEMFYGCRSLNYVRCISVISDYTMTNEIATKNWLYGVSSTGTFVKSSKAWNWTRGASGIPVGWEKTDD